LAIPVFIRGREGSEGEILEFTTALNVSAGGMLVALRRAFPSLARVTLQIPSSPLAASTPLPKAARNIRAKVLRLEHAEGYNLCGLEFSKPLVTSRLLPPVGRRKLASSV